MPRALSRFYNFRTKIWHRLLRRPIRLKPVFDNKIKDPRLVVVFLHGISATSETWKTTFKQFAKNPDLKNVRFIAYDLLGFGRSLQPNWLDYDYLDYNTALDNSLKRLGAKCGFVLIGHSMGALVAMDYAANFKASVEIDSLILVSPPVLMAEELAKLPDKVYTKSYSSLYQLAKDEPAMEVIANFIQRFSSFSSKYIKTPAFGKSMEQIILNHHNFTTLNNLKIPTLIIHGHFDPLVMRSNLKRAADNNSGYVKFVSVMGHHDISAQKRTKILIELKRILRNNGENNA